jgi:NTE family protein
MTADDRKTISLVLGSGGARGLVKGDKIINTLVDLVGDKTIEELPIPFTAIATDIENEKEIWINTGACLTQ